MALSSGLRKLSIITTFDVQPFVSKSLYNCALTSNRCNSSKSFLSFCSRVIKLKFGLNKISPSFIGWLLIHFHLHQSRSIIWVSEAAESTSQPGRFKSITDGASLKTNVSPLHHRLPQPALAWVCSPLRFYSSVSALDSSQHNLRDPAPLCHPPFSPVMFYGTYSVFLH